MRRLIDAIDGKLQFKATFHAIQSEGRGWVLLVIAGGWALSLGTRFIFPTILSDISQTFELDLTVAGLLVSTLWFAYALGQFPGGILADRVGEGRILLVSTGLAVIMIAIVTFSINKWFLFLGTALFGVSTALYGPTRFTIMTDIYPDRDGTAIGFIQAAGDIGSSVLPVVAGVCAAYGTWRLGFGVTLPVFCLVFVGLWKFVPSQTSGATSAVDDLTISSLKYVLKSMLRRAILIVTTVQIFRTFVYHAFTGFFPTYLVGAKGFSRPVAAGLFGLFFAMGVIVQPAAGVSNDRFGARRTLLSAMTLTVVALFTLPFVASIYGALLVTVLLSSLSAVTPITQTYLTNTLPADMKGTGLGALRTVFIMLGSSGPLVVGAFADRGLFDEAFMLLGGMILVAFAFSYFVPTLQ